MKAVASLVGCFCFDGWNGVSDCCARIATNKERVQVGECERRGSVDVVQGSKGGNKVVGTRTWVRLVEVVGRGWYHHTCPMGSAALRPRTCRCG